MNFCVSCGKKNLFKDNLCKQCYLKYNPELKKAKKIVLSVCKICNTYQSEHQWLPLKDYGEALKKVVLRSTNLKEVKLDFEIPELDRKKTLVDVLISSGGQQYLLPATIRNTVCPKCQRRRTSYYEVIFQLRKPSKHLHSFFEDQLRTREIHVSQKDKVRNGMDYYLDDQKGAKRILKLLRQKYHGLAKTARKLYTEDKQSSKRIYRWTLLFRLFPYSKNDIFVYQGKTIKIRSIDNDIIGVDVETSQKIALSFEELERAKVF